MSWYTEEPSRRWTESVSGIQSPFLRLKNTKVSVEPVMAMVAALIDGAAQLVAHPLEYGSMFQDRAGTIPVTASGQHLGRCLDVGGGGHHATAVSDLARGIFRDEDGFRWVEYNGTTTSYSTGALPAPGADKVQAFSGLRKLTDTTTKAIVELATTPATTNESFGVYSTSSALYAAISRGSIAAQPASNLPIPAPASNALTFLGDISGGRATVRVDGMQVAQTTSSQGTGNYNNSGTYPLFYGSRAGTSLFFVGNHYATIGPVVRFSTANATPQQIDTAEAFYASVIAT